MAGLLRDCWRATLITTLFMSETTSLIARLQSLPLFAEFTVTELEAFISLVECQTFPAGAAIVHQDDPGEAMFIILSGKASVRHRAGDQSLELALLQTGDFFGELALVDEGPRSADVVAVEPVETVSVPQAMIRALAGVYPSAAFKLLVAVGRVLVARLRACNKKYVDSLLMARPG